MSKYSKEWGFGGVFGLVDLPPVVIKIPFLTEIVFKSEISYYYLALFFLLLTIYIVYCWKRSRFGRAGMALRENEVLAKSIGISPHMVLTLIFSLSTALAGLTGAVYGHYVRAVHPWMFMVHYMLIMMVCLFVGGPGTLGGPVVGSLIYMFAVEPLRVSEPAKLVLLGTILLVFMRFMPQGVYPVFRSFVINISSKFSMKQKK
jgi:branched-chain amino acid transport system permease protein